MRRANRLGSLILLGLAAFASVVCGAPTDDVSMEDAVRQGDLEVIDRYIDRGADLDSQFETGMTPLMLAAARNAVDVGTALLDAGADIDRTGREGMTPLQVAARLGSTEFLDLLLDRGADSEHVSDNGMSTIHHAAAGGTPAVISELAARGMDLDARSETIVQGHGYPRDRGPTPLSIAVAAGKLDNVYTLLDEGADVDAPSTAGITPLLTAVFVDDKPILEHLLLRGADTTISVPCDDACSVEGSLDAAGWAVELGRSSLIPLLGGTS